MRELNFNHFKQQLVRRTPSMTEILTIAEQMGPNNLFVAGGAVRDYCCGKNEISGDIDLFFSESCNKPINKLQQSYGKKITNQFGSTRWFPTDNIFYYDLIQIKDFNQGLWECFDIVDVLNQFDITANAIAFDLNNGAFINPVNGLRDATDKTIRAVRFDFPEIMVSELIPISRNSVLWFRYNHYSTKLNSTIEPITKKWLQENKYRIKDKAMFAKFFFNPEVDL